jgi:hypothetical protein
MGWGRMMLMGNWGQQMDIEEQRREIAALKEQSSSTDAAVNLDQLILQEKYEELKLYLAALIRYLGNKGILDQDDFAKIVDMIDAEDGKADGAYDGPIVR